VVLGETGKYAALARRKDSTWFVGAITNNDARTLRLPCSFLKPGEQYTATIYTDGGGAVTTRTHVAITAMPVTSSSVLTLDLRPSGGAALEIRPATDGDGEIHNR
jgi:alpha-glucosidase